MKMIKIGVILITLLVGFNSCKKEDMSEYLKKEDITIENLNFTIQPSQWSWNSNSQKWEYSITHGFINSGILSGYVQGPYGKEELPYYDANAGVTYSIVDNTAQNQILITYYDGTTSIQHPSYEEFVYLTILTYP